MSLVNRVISEGSKAVRGRGGAGRSRTGGSRTTSRPARGGSRKSPASGAAGKLRRFLPR